MQRLQNTSKRVLAALMFFTRIPFWRIAEVEKKNYEGLVPLWPLAGWFTGGVMCLVAWLAMHAGLSIGASVLLAILSRLLLTGALHEEGFADFCDGFGGGTTKESILTIMKDSHIGSYGVIGLIFYYLLFWNCLTVFLGQGWSPLMLIVVDTISKWMASLIIYVLPYARSESEAKNGVVYVRTPLVERVMSVVLALIPFVFVNVLSVEGVPPVSLCIKTLLIPLVGVAWLFLMMHRRIHGYTGDCCGATFIITEMLLYLSLCVVLS